MDIVDIGTKLGLSGTTLLFFYLFIREQIRHDATRDKYTIFEKERQEKDRDLARERLAVERERVGVDRESTVAFTKLESLLSVLVGRKGA